MAAGLYIYLPQNQPAGHPSSDQRDAPESASPNNTNQEPELPKLAECTPVPPKTSVLPVETQPRADGTYVFDADLSCVAYTVQEKFLDRPLPNLAVGTTSTLGGHFIVTEDGKVAGGTVAVDLQTITSDSERRDGIVRGLLTHGDKYPHALFTITGADKPVALREGQETEIQLQGTMRIAEAEKPLAFTANVKYSGGTVELTATTRLLMSDFGFRPPSVLNMVKVEDTVQLFVRAVLRRGAKDQ